MSIGSMGRRRPSAVRAAQQRAQHTAIIPGLSPSTCHALNRLDRDELRPDAGAAALRRWQATARDPNPRRRSGASATGPHFSDLRPEEDQFYCPACAAGTVPAYEPTDRDILRRAAFALPRGKSRQLRRLVHRADQRLLRATLPDPSRRPEEPWWYRRILSR